MYYSRDPVEVATQLVVNRTIFKMYYNFLHLLECLFGVVNRTIFEMYYNAGVWDNSHGMVVNRTIFKMYYNDHPTIILIVHVVNRTIFKMYYNSMLSTLPLALLSIGQFSRCITTFSQ